MQTKMELKGDWVTITVAVGPGPIAGNETCEDVIADEMKDLIDALAAKAAVLIPRTEKPTSQGLGELRSA